MKTKYETTAMQKKNNEIQGTVAITKMMSKVLGYGCCSRDFIQCICSERQFSNEKDKPIH